MWRRDSHLSAPIHGGIRSGSAGSAGSVGSIGIAGPAGIAGFSGTLGVGGCDVPSLYPEIESTGTL